MGKSCVTYLLTYLLLTGRTVYIIKAVLEQGRIVYIMNIMKLYTA